MQTKLQIQFCICYKLSALGEAGGLELLCVWCSVWHSLWILNSSRMCLSNVRHSQFGHRWKTGEYFMSVSIFSCISTHKIPVHIAFTFILFLQITMLLVLHVYDTFNYIYKQLKYHPLIMFIKIFAVQNVQYIVTANHQYFKSY